MPVFNNALAGAAGQAGGAAAAGPIKSVRFNRDDTAYLNKTFSSDGNRRKFTYSFWVKRNNVGASEAAVLVEARVTGTPSADSDAFSFRFDTSDRIRVADWGNFYITSTARFRDPSAWYHLVLSVDTAQASNNISVYVNGVLNKQGTYPQNTDTRVNAGSGTVHEIGTRTYGYPSDNYYLDAQLADFYFIDGQALDPTSFGAFDDNGVWQAAAYSGTYGTNGFHLLDFANESTIGHDSSGNNNDFTANNLSPFRAGNGTYGATISNSTLNNDPSVIFNGTPSSSYVDRPINNSTVTFTGIPEASTSVRIYLTSLESGTMTTNGSYAVSPGSQFPNAYIEPTNVTYPFTLTSITVTGGNSGHGYGIGAIEVDGVELENQSGPECDVLFDVPTNGTQSDTGAGGEVSGNYATLNPLDSSGTGTFSNGNLEALAPTSGNSFNIRATIAPTSGKWYWEYTMLKEFGIYGGIVLTSFDINTTSAINANGGVAMGGGSLFNGGSNVSSSPTQAVTGDVMGFAWDVDNDSLEFFLNGTSQGTVSSIADGHYAPAVTCTPYSSGGGNIAANFGARSFAYSAPSGYKALCTTNLPTPTIADGSTAMDVVLDTGANILTAAQGAIGGSADLLWIKDRANTNNHQLIDTVRGGTATLQSNTTAAETTYSAPSGNSVAWTWDAGSSNTTITAGSLNSSLYDQSQTWSNSLTASNGFMSGYGATYGFNGQTSGNHAGSNSGGTLTFAPNLTIPANSTIEVYAGSAASAYMDISVNGVSNNSTPGGAFVQVNYDNSTTLTSLTITRTGGGNSADLRGIKINGKLLVDSGVTLANVPSIASTVRANPSAGFSIVSYTGNNTTGATVAHGLNTTPSWIIIKNRSTAYNWIVLYTDTSKKLYLDLTNTPDAYSQTTRNSSYFTLENGTAVNGSGDDMIAYCFAPVEGYSAFGSYTGGGSSNVFVYTGFKPKFLLIKASSSAQSWVICDAARHPINNGSGYDLKPDTNESEGNNIGIDILSNGFRNVYNSNLTNGSGITYIYMAFAENPFKYARAR